MSKTLLFIQIVSYDDEILPYLKSRGVKIILFANNLTTNKKDLQYADEVYEYVNYNEDYFIRFAKEHNVDAIYARDCEEYMESLRRMNEAIGNKFSHTESQWHSFMNKIRFKKLLNKYKIPNAKLIFASNLKGIWKLIFHPFKLPVLVKPSDSIACNGLSILRKYKDLPIAAARAIHHSKEGTFFIEKYIAGLEISATYVVQNHVCKLVCIYDKYKYKEGNMEFSFLCVSPSKYIDLFLKDVDPVIQQMAKDEGLNNCTFFLQAIVKDNKFYILECGLRREGTDINLMTRIFAKQDFAEFIIDSILGIPTKYDINKEDPYLRGQYLCCYDVPLYKGSIYSIKGMDKWKDNPLLIYFYQFKKESSFSIHSSMFGAALCCYALASKNVDDICYVLEDIQSSLEVRDSFNNDMIDRSVDIVSIVKSYKDK